MPEKSTLALKEMFLDGLRKSARSPSIFGYRPHELQEMFHRDESTGRIFLGGNRSGKTVGGAVETVYRLRGQHPYQRVPEVPIRARGVAVDIKQGINKIMIPEIKRWIPPSDLINGSWEDSYDKQQMTLTLRNESMLEFLTYEMDIEKHAGTSRHWIWFDEEPPQYIFNEDLLRLVDTRGKWCMTMTPIEGMTWVYYNYYRPIIEEEDQTVGSVAIFLISTVQNPHVDPGTLDEMTRGMSESEKLARKHGQFMAASGLVYPEFNEKVHVVDPLNYSELGSYLMVAAMDHGLRNPTCWLWAILDHEGRITVFHEHYAAELTIKQHADAIKEFERQYGYNFDGRNYRIGDPAIGQRSQVTGGTVQSEYAEHEIFIGTGNNDVNYGLNRVRSYFQASGLFITNNCTNTIKELRNYRWDTWATRKQNEEKEAKDRPKKTKDHACDTLRYLVASRPEEEFVQAAGKLYLPFSVSKAVEPHEPFTEQSLSMDDILPDYNEVLGSNW